MNSHFRVPSPKNSTALNFEPTITAQVRVNNNCQHAFLLRHQEVHRQRLLLHGQGRRQAGPGDQRLQREGGHRALPGFLQVCANISLHFPQIFQPFLQENVI